MQRRYVPLNMYNLYSQKFNKTDYIILDNIHLTITFLHKGKFYQQMRLLLDQMKSDWIVVSGPEVDILKKSAKAGRLLSLTYVGK